ncbi:MAG TPA: DUF2497 domain-containing protein [Novosphingobium sp.]|nr:DUF2497 domain-containing protein [Novosphingobium sp.]
MRQPGEPSVEDILDSIKKVIARDTRAATPRTAREETARPAVEDVLDLAVSAQFLEPEDSAPGAVDPALVAPEARASMRESLAALAMMAEPRTPPQIVRSGETSLEEMTRELLKPALAAWLDKNLPPMVEQMVATEIARIVGKKG